MRVHRIVAGLSATALMVAGTAPATADWQFTKWGMTVAQVQAAAKGKALPCSPDACAKQSIPKSQARLTGEYRAGEFVFDAWYGFDAKGRLNSVSLKVVYPDQVFPIVGAMRAKYGNVESGSRDALGETRVWRDKADQITLMVIGSDYATINYEPRVTASSAGL